MSAHQKPLDEEDSKTLNDRPARNPKSQESSNPPPLPLPGQRLVKRYAVLQMLGEGGMGVVLSAYDEQLDRRVALKLLRRVYADNSTLEARLVREAQAMARLNHPHVVAVYDSGRLEDGTFFIAMEYVEGMTLQAWCQQTQRSWREVLGAYLEAGRGLAAAHAVGLIHRDFKPANVLVGQDGRVRVTDFGVARVEASSAQDSVLSRRGTAWESPLTLAGHVVGTPYYLPPELLNEQPADARSDLFSFCVALYEALYGQSPFAGDTANERMRARLEGRVTPPPAKTQVPGWVGRAVIQGLSAEPEMRPSSMLALIEILQNDPEVMRRARLRMGLGVAGVVVLVGLGVWGGWRWQDPGCGAMERRLVGVWDAPMKARMREAMVGTGLSYAEDTAQRVEATLDRYAGTWMQMSQEVCEAANTGVKQARGFVVLREACLERRRSQLRALTGLLTGSPDPELVPKAFQAALDLPPVSYCADEKALLASVPPPDEPGLRIRVNELEHQADRVEALLQAGKYSKGLVLADKVLSEVQGVDFTPLKARALFLMAESQRATGEYKSAEARLREAIPLAAREGDTLLLARAWNSLASVMESRQNGSQEVLGLELTLDSMAALTRDDMVRADALDNVGSAFYNMGKYEEALVRHERALELEEKTRGPEHPSTAVSLNNLGNVLHAMGQNEKALTLYERALVLKERTLGPEHPEVASSLNNLGIVLSDMGRYEESLALYERALDLRERTLGSEHPKVATLLNSLGSVLYNMGRYEEALARFEQSLKLNEKALGTEHLEVAVSLNNICSALHALGRYNAALPLCERALVLKERTLGPEHPSTAVSLSNLGDVLSGMGRYQEALARHERAVAVQEKALGLEHPSLAMSLNSLGGVLLKMGWYKNALPYLERALALNEKALGPEHPDVAETLLRLGELHLAQRRPSKAVVLLERALALSRTHDKAEAQFLLAQALWESDGDKRRAVKLATQAHAQWQAPKHPRQAETAQWLAAHSLP